MMMIRYSIPVEPSTIFQSFVGEKGEGGAVAAGSMLPPSTGSCMLAPSEKGHLAATFSTAAGWCAGGDHPGAAASVNSKTGDTFVSLRELHNPRSIGACREERDCGSSDQIGWATMFHSSGAPPPPGGPQQPLQQHKSSSDVVSSVHVGRLMNTRVRHASAATTAPGVAPAVSLAQGSAHENGAKQFSGPYNRTGHLPHDAHSRKRRQGGNANGGGDAESEGAVAGGHGAGDQSARAYTQVRQPLKHGRGGGRTRFDSLGDGRDARGREAGERQAGPGGPVGLAAHPPNCADSFPLWGGPGISCQTQSSPPPPPEDTTAGAQQTPADSSSCRQVIRPTSSGTNSQSSGAERGGRNWRGLSPGRGAPPPPPPHAMKAVLRACYSDQIIDNSRGLPCFKRLKAAFVSVAEVAGHPDLIVPRYLNLARRLPPAPFQHPRLHQSVPLPPPAAPGGAAPAGAAAEDRRGSPAPQGEQAGLQSRDAHVAKTTAVTGLGSSSSRSGAGASTAIPGTWSAQAVAGGRSCPSAESVSSHVSIGSGETKQPPWLNRNADPGRQIMQEEMSEVSSVDSDDDEMEDGEVAEEAARVQTRQQQHVGVKDSRVSRTDATSPGDGSAPTAPARVPPWVSTTAAGVVHGLRSSSQQQQVYPRAFPSQADGQIPAEQQSTSVPDVREAHQQKSADTLSFQCGLPTVPHGSSSSSKRTKQYPSETPGATACPADGEAPSGRTSVQHFPSASELTSGQLSCHTSVVVETPEDRPYSGLSGIVTASGGSSGLQNVRSTSSCSATAQQPETSTGAALLQPPAASHAGVVPSRGCSAVAHPGSHVLQPPGEAGEAHAETGGSCVHQDNCYRPKTCIAAGNTSAGAAAKPRPVDPRLTRQPKLQAGHQGRSAGCGTLQEGRSAAVSAPADIVDMTASSVGTAESSVERKNQPDPAASSVQPATAVALTSVCSSSSSSTSSNSSGSKSDSASAASTAEAQTQPTRYYVCSIDGSRVELKPPQAPAPGTLPESLAGTCIARGKLPLLLDLDNTLLHAQAAAVTGCDVRLQDWLDENGEPELFRFELSCNRKSYYMKLRPHLRTFLRVLEPYYEMSVYTNATQEYADIVVAILDENRQLFSDRIVARNSGFRGEASENKAVRRMYENMDKRCIVAFDDRQNIWTDLPLSHVVKAQHYDFFDSHRAELNAYYPPLPTIGSNGCGLPSIDALGRMSDEIGIGGELGLPDENQQQQQGKGDQQLLKSATSGKKPCDWDKHLDCMLKLFLRIHTEFFRDPAKANIGAILSTVQQSVLSGVGIFFTGYRKTYSPGAAVADCEERQAELAQRLGAKVYKRFDEEGVTHVVAGKNNTNNMLACRENTKLSRVHTLWLYCCEAALTRVPESAFEADALCAYYENSPPTSPYRDHWIHLAQKDDAANEEKGGANSSKTEIATGSDGAPWLSVAHQHHPLPPQDSLPVREFLGTGPYSDGATLTSPYEEIVFIWRPDKQTVRQLYGEDIRGAAAPPAASTLNTSAPFGSLSPNTGVLLAPVKSGLSGGTANIPSSTAALGPTDVRVPGLFGERAVEASVFTQSLHAANDEGLLESRRVGVLAHGSCPQMQLGLPYE